MLAAVAVAAALVVVASALAAVGRDPFGAVSSWLKGAPGELASREEQVGFTGRSGASYAAFPAGIEVHRVGRAVAGTKTFTLLGFASGDSFCLRVVPADNPSRRGTNECVTHDELAASPAPALVASETRFSFGKGGKVVDGIFGFADDTVRAIEYRRGRGRWSSVPIANNVFLALGAHHGNVPPSAPVGADRAGAGGDAVGRADRRPVRGRLHELRGRRAGRAELPDVRSRTTGGSPRPDGRDTSRRGRAGRLDRPRGEQRGSAWKPSPGDLARLGTLVRSRAIQPDSRRSVPRRPLPRPPAHGLVGGRRRPRQARGLRERAATPGRHRRRELPARRDGRWRALAQRPLGRHLRLRASARTSPARRRRRLAALRLFLASGRVIPVALRDNVYSVSASSGQFPAKLVAYDDAGRVIGLEMFAGPAPDAVPDGPRLADVEAALDAALPASRPRRARAGRLADLRSQPREGAGGPRQARARRGVLPLERPADLLLRRHPAVRGGADRALRPAPGKAPRRPAGLPRPRPRSTRSSAGYSTSSRRRSRQQQLAATYGGTFRRSLEYGSLPATMAGFIGGSGCTGEFRDANGVVRISFGVEPATRRPFLSIWHPY